MIEYFTEDEVMEAVAMQYFADLWINSTGTVGAAVAFLRAVEASERWDMN